MALRPSPSGGTPAFRPSASSSIDAEETAAKGEVDALDAAAAKERHGVLNFVSDHLLDTFSRKGKALDAAVKVMDADARAVLRPGSAPSSAKLEELSSDFDGARSALGAYDHTKSTTSQIAGGVLAGAVMLGTGGAGRSFFGLVKSPFLGMALKGTSTQLATKLVVDGRTYLGRPILQDLVTSSLALSSMVGLRALGTGRAMSALLGGGKVARSVGGALEGGLMGGTTSVVAGSVGAAMAPGVWRGGTKAGLHSVGQRVEKMAKMAVPFGLATGAILGPLPDYVAADVQANRASQARLEAGTVPETEATASAAGEGAAGGEAGAALQAPIRRQTFLRHVIHDLHRIFNMAVMRPAGPQQTVAPNPLPALLGASGTASSPLKKK